MVWDRFDVVLGIDLGWFWDRFGIGLGSVWVGYGIVDWESVRDRVASFVSVSDRFGSLRIGLGSV